MRARWVWTGAIAVLALAKGFATEYRPLDAPQTAAQRAIDPAAFAAQTRFPTHDRSEIAIPALRRALTPISERSTGLDRSEVGLLALAGALIEILERSWSQVGFSEGRAGGGSW